jgi:hypothetical protein
MCRTVYVDGINKGEVFKRSGRWFWRRGEVAVEPFGKGSTLKDVAEWARTCCNGQKAKVCKPKVPTLPEIKEPSLRTLRRWGKEWEAKNAEA